MKISKLTFSLLILIIIVFVSFYPSLDNGFTNWDDDGMLTDNNMIKSLSIKNMVENFNLFDIESYNRNKFARGMYIPLVFLSYALEYNYFGLLPRVFHATNLFVHILNSLLVFWFIYLISGKYTVSFIASLLFGIHPLHVESVVWITERKDVLYGFFFLLSIICYIYYLSGKKIYYAYALVFFILSLLSKTMAIMLPFVLILLDYVKKRRMSKEIFIEKLPFIILAMVPVFVMIFLTNQKEIIIGTGRAFSVNRNICMASYGILVYLVRIIMPLNLSCLYPEPSPYPDIVYMSPFIIVLLSTFFLGVVRINKSLLFGVFFFLITILPVVNLLPLPGGITSDRYTYITFIGLFYIIGEYCDLFLIGMRAGSIVMRRLLMAFLLILIIFFSFLTWQRCKIWKDSEVLWSDVIRKYPKVVTAYLNRGDFYSSTGNYDFALNDYNMALELKPDSFKTLSNRGAQFLKIGRYEEAYKDLMRSIEIEPMYPEAYLNRGVLFLTLGQYDGAIKNLNKAIALKEDFLQAYINRGNAYREKGDFLNALNDYEKALSIDRKNSEAFANRGSTYFKMNNYDKAIENFSRAIELKPDYVMAYSNRGTAYREIGSMDKALNDYEKALSIKTNSPEIFVNRGLIYFKQKEYDKALSDFNMAIYYNPSFVHAYYYRSRIYKIKMEYDKANMDLERLKQLRFNGI